MGALGNDQKVETAVYLIETGKAAPSVACRQLGVSSYAVEEARKKLGPGHRFNEDRGLYYTREEPIWVRKIR
jgi:hypothetical protein